MRALEVIRAIDGQGEVRCVTGDEHILWEVPFRGFSRGFGEFMRLTAHLTGQARWTCWMPADIEYDVADIVKASRTAPSEFWALALSEDSHASHGWTRKQGQGWREVPFVDLAPVYSRSFVMEAEKHFGESVSGWGLDLIFADMNRRRNGHTAHVCDDFTMRHHKELESHKWLIDGKSPMDELAHIRRKFNL